MRIVQCKNATASCFSHVEPKHFLVKTEDSPGSLDGPSDSGDYAASVNRQQTGGQLFSSFQYGNILENSDPSLGMNIL